VEQFVHQEGTELLRRLFQGHLDLRAANEVQYQSLVGSDQHTRPHHRKDTHRQLALFCHFHRSKIGIKAETKEGTMTAPRDPKPTVNFIDVYCSYYQDLFPEVRSFENFKALHLGMLSELKRKTLPEIAKVAGLDNSQSLHHFLTESPWDVEALKYRRLNRILQVLEGRSIIVIIDETGDPKAGKSTDYVKRQYLGKLGKIDNGIVAVIAYGIIEEMTFPLTFKIYKPRERLKPGDEYQTKPQIASEMIRELQKIGFKIELVLADSLYGESGSSFISVLDEFNLNYTVAIRSNHAVWIPLEQRVRSNKWRKFNRIFSDGTTELRYIREIIFGTRNKKCYWQITSDPVTLPESSTWWVMTKIPGIKYKEVGNIFGLRTWVEYGLRQSKNELGWADFRLTEYPHIQKWWEIVCSAYLLVSLYSEHLNPGQKLYREYFQVIPGGTRRKDGRIYLIT
jgi:SRSO17 transposase